MNKIRSDALKSPISHVIIIMLFAIGLSALPINRLFDLFIEDAKTAELFGQATIRFVISIIAVVFIRLYGFKNVFKGKPTLRWLLIIPALIVAINNAPIIGLLTGNVVVSTTSLKTIGYILFCVSVGFFEELVFRGLVFPLTLILFRKIKNGVFWSVALSSALFGLTHLVNLIAGQGILPTLLQIGYSFLIGAMCAIAMVISKNVFIAILLHTVYDLGGLMVGSIALGNQWDVVTIIITAVIGVLTAGFMVYLTLKFKGEEVKVLYGDGLGDIDKSSAPTIEQ